MRQSTPLRKQQSCKNDKWSSGWRLPLAAPHFTLTSGFSPYRNFHFWDHTGPRNHNTATLQIRYATIRYATDRAAVAGGRGRARPRSSETAALPNTMLHWPNLIELHSVSFTHTFSVCWGCLCWGFSHFVLWMVCSRPQWRPRPRPILPRKFQCSASSSPHSDQEVPVFGHFGRLGMG